VLIHRPEGPARFHLHGPRSPRYPCAPITGGHRPLLMIWMTDADREKLRRVIAAALPGFAQRRLLSGDISDRGPAAQCSRSGRRALSWVLILELEFELAISNRGVSRALVATVARGVVGAGAGCRSS